MDLTEDDRAALFRELSAFFQAVTAGDSRRAKEALVRMQEIVAP